MCCHNERSNLKGEGCAALRYASLFALVDAKPGVQSRETTLSGDQIPRVDVFDRRIANGKRRVVRRKPDPVTQKERAAFNTREARNLLYTTISYRNTEDRAAVGSSGTKINILAIVRPVWIAGWDLGERPPLPGIGVKQVQILIARMQRNKKAAVGRPARREITRRLRQHCDFVRTLIQNINSFGLRFWRYIASAIETAAAECSHSASVG